MREREMHIGRERETEMDGMDGGRKRETDEGERERDGWNGWREKEEG